jgi:hypothetical protein
VGHFKDSDDYLTYEVPVPFETETAGDLFRRGAWDLKQENCKSELR